MSAGDLALLGWAMDPLNADRRDVDVQDAHAELAWLAGEQS